MTAPAAGAAAAPSARAYGAIAVATVLAVAACWVVIDPVGEYPVDDDWAYVRSLRHLHDEGRLVLLDWNPMSLVGLLAWGLVFTKAFGFSFTVTKLAVAATLAVECGALLAALRHFAVPPTLAAMAVATLLLGPLHLFHGFEFSTDVPAVAWSMVALLLWVRALDGPPGWRETGLLLGGAACALAAFLTRQSGGLIVPALALYAVLWDRRRLRSPAFLAAVLLPAAAAVAFSRWFRGVHGATAALSGLEAAVRDFVLAPPPAEVARALFVVASYVGLFLLPLSLTALPPWPRSRRARVAVAVVAVALAAGLAAAGPFPYLRNKLTPFGYLRPNELIVGDRPVLWPPGAGWPIGAVLAASALLLAVALAAAPRLVRAGPGAAGRRLLLLVVAAQAAYALVTWPILFDRHLLLLAPTSVLLYCVLVRDRIRPRPIACATLLVPLGLYAVAGTHDVHAISRTAFVAGGDLLAAGVDAHAIDGGYAFDGWHTYRSSRRRPALPRARRDDAWWIQVLYPTIRTDWVLSLSPALDYARMAPAITGPDRELFLMPRLDAYRVARTYPYPRLWPPGTGALYVMADTRTP